MIWCQSVRKVWKIETTYVASTEGHILMYAVALEVVSNASGLWPNDVIPNAQYLIPNAQYLIHDRLNT